MTGIAYSYVRFSTPDQLKGDSLRRQLDLSERYAEEHGLEIDTTLTLRDLGISAFDRSNVERGNLGVFLKAVQTGVVKPGSFLLVESLDRLSRANVMDALSIFTDLTNAGITIVTLTDGMAYSKESIQANWTQLIVSLAIMARAHEESAMKSKRLSSVWAEKKRNAAQKVVTSRVPAWLKVVDGEIVVVEKNADIIREIFRLIRDGYGLHLLERKLNSEGVPTIGRATSWHRSYLAKLVHNRSIIGEYQPMTGKAGAQRPSGDVVKGYYPAILSESEFYATQKAIEDRHHMGGRKGRGIANIFSGLCRCGYCGGPMQYVNKNAATKWQYLVCGNAKRGLGCKHVPWRYDEFENSILLRLRDIDIAAILKDDTAQRAKNELESEKAKLSDTKKRIGKLIELAEISDDVAEVGARLAELKDERKATAQKVQDLEAQAEAPTLGKKHFEQFRKLRESLDQAQGDELTDLRLRVSHELKRFLTRIELYPDGDDPWAFRMILAGVHPGRTGRFTAVFFKSGKSLIFPGGVGGVVDWPGPKTEEKVRTAKSFPSPQPHANETAGELTGQEMDADGELATADQKET